MSKLSDPTLARIETEGQEGGAFDAAAFEQQNVHEVYQNIASHFSETRYKPWPLVPEFLATLPPGSIGADLGCGNGKYLHVRSLFAPPLESTAPTEQPLPSRDLVTIGLDRSSNLIDLARSCFPSSSLTPRVKRGKQKDVTERPTPPPSQRHEVAVSDALHSSLRSGAFDYAISIATIHHFATSERREEAAIEMIRLIRPQRRRPPDSAQLPTALAEGSTDTSAERSDLGTGTGRFMIYAWALEQRGESRRAFETVAEQDCEGDAARREPERRQDLLVPWVLKSSDKTGARSNTEEQTSSLRDAAEPEVFQRYYHVFRSGELESLVERAASRWRSRCEADGREPVRVNLQASGWERGNWWGVWNVIADDLSL